MVINRKEIAKKKLESLKQGYSAYTESKEVAAYIQKEIDAEQLCVIVDATPIGQWFIPCDDHA